MHNTPKHNSQHPRSLLEKAWRLRYRCGNNSRSNWWKYNRYLQLFCCAIVFW